MGSHENVKAEILRELVVEGDEFEVDDILILAKESCKGVSIYKIYTGLGDSVDVYDITEYYATHSREKAEKYFSMLVNSYPEERIISKII